MIEFESIIQIKSKKHTQFKMPRLPLLEALINLNMIKSIKTTKFHNFLNKYDKNKIKTWEILINLFRSFDEIKKRSENG